VIDDVEENVGSGKLQKMFDSLKIKHRSSDPIHVEFIMKAQGRTVVSHYFNETGINEVASGTILN